jgi:hypothetical protein
MKIKFTCFLSFLFSCFLCQSQTPVQWQKCFGGSDNDIPYCIRPIADGSYVLAGYSTSNDSDVTGNHGSRDHWIIKIDSLGNLLWQKCFGGTAHDIGYSVLQTNDGGFILGGNSSSNDGDVTGHHGTSATSDMWIVKIDTGRNIEWQRSLGGTLNDNAVAPILQAAGGNYIVAGASKSNDGDVIGNHGLSDVWIINLDSAGIINWQKCFGGSFDDVPFCIQPTMDAGYIIAGTTQSIDGDVTANHGAEDFWIVKIDSAGTIQWQKSLGGTKADIAYFIRPTSDGGYVVAGSSRSHDGDVVYHYGSEVFPDFWILKLDSSGAIEWQRVLGGTGGEEAKYIEEAADGSYFISGYTYSNDGDVTSIHPGANPLDAWIVLLSSTGALIWEKCLGGSNEDGSYSALLTSDGGYIMSALTLSDDGDVSGHHGFYDFWVVRLSPFVGIDETETAGALSCYPNPTANELNIESIYRMKSLAVYDIFGKKIFRSDLAGKNKVTLDIGAFANGIYFIEVSGENNMCLHRKILKQ